MAEVWAKAVAAGKPEEGWGAIELHSRVTVEHIPDPEAAQGERVVADIQINSTTMTLPDVAAWVEQASRTWDAQAVLPADARWTAAARG